MSTAERTGGLTTAEVATRVAAGQLNRSDQQTSRTVGEIVRANVLTVFNALLGALFVIILCTGRWQNGLFGLVVIANSGIGIIQEVRAKRTLDRLALLNAPRAHVIRDGAEQEIAVGDVVQDDLVVARAGDQIVADGTVRESAGLEIDESLLTGESDPIAKAVPDQVRSGSIVVAGQGRYRAEAVGAAAYAATLTAEAKRFTVTRSELIEGTNRLLRWISLAMLVVAPVLVWSQFRSSDNHGWQDAVTGAVAALVGMVPEGLVLLTSLAFVIATVTLIRKSTLVQELPAVEGLARVDVVCLDKTGTLTHGDIRFARLDVLAGAEPDDVHAALALLSNTGEANPTAAALAEQFAGSPWTALDAIPFSSARKWSAVRSAERGSWVLGAPEMVLHAPADDDQQAARAQADGVAAEGSRVLLLARTTGAAQLSAERPLPTDLTAAALVVLAENIRDDAAATLEYFTAQGVALKIISGDNPRTVGAVATALGVPGVRAADDAVDARTLPEDLDELGATLDEHSVFGRVTPHQKRAIVQALQRQGHVVAMTGDGVNDALALKDADIGVAMGNGTAATRAVAQIVLMDGRFAHLPDVVAEGRRVIANIERVANLFLVKNVYSLVLAIIVAITAAAYPLAPIQLTLISSVTIGVPAFVLALGPNQRRYIPGFLPRVMRFAIPTGAIIAAVAYAGYRITRASAGADVAAGRTTAALVVLVVSLWTLLILARPLAAWKIALVAVMAGAVVLIVAIHPLGHGVFLLDMTGRRAGVGLALGVLGAALVEVAHRVIRARSREATLDA